MSTTRFILLGLILSLTRAASESHLTKCCPPGEIILHSVNFTAKCTSVLENAIELYVSYWNTIAAFQGIPQCNKSEELMITPFNDRYFFNNSLEVNYND